MSQIRNDELSDIAGDPNKCCCSQAQVRWSVRKSARARVVRGNAGANVTTRVTPRRGRHNIHKCTRGADHALHQWDKHRPIKHEFVLVSLAHKHSGRLHTQMSQVRTLLTHLWLSSPAAPAAACRRRCPPPPVPPMVERSAPRRRSCSLSVVATLFRSKSPPPPPSPTVPKTFLPARHVKVFIPTSPRAAGQKPRPHWLPRQAGADRDWLGAPGQSGGKPLTGGGQVGARAAWF